MNLLILRVHGVFRQRLQMLPATQRAEPSDIRSIVNGKIAAIALAVDGTLGVGRAELAALGDGLAVRADQPLRDVETAAVALRQSDHGGEFCLAYRRAQFLGLRAVVRQRVVEIA